MLHSRHPIFSNTLYNLLNTVISFVVAYAMTPVILSRLGNEDYGIWVFLSIFTVTGYFSLLDLGLQGAATKYVAEFLGAKDNERLSQIVSATILFFFIVGVIGAAIVLIINAFFLTDVFNLPTDQIAVVRMLINLIAISFIFQFPALGYSAIIQGVQRYDYLRGVTILTTLLSNAILLFYLNETNGIVFITIVTIVTAILVTLLYAYITKRLLPTISIRLRHISKDTFRLLFNLSSKLFASKIVGLIFNNTDKLLIAIFLTVSFQTDYDIVNKLHIILLSLLSIVNQVVLPASSEFSAKHDTHTLRILLLRATKYSVGLVLPALILLMAYPTEMLIAWVGDGFAHLAPLVRLYSSHIFLTMLVGVSSTMFVGINKVGKVLKVSIFAAVLNLGISVITVPSLKITGLILATVIAYSLSSLAYIYIANKTFIIPHWHFFKEVLFRLISPSIGALAVMIAGHAALDLTSFWNIGIVAALMYIVFFVMMYFFSLGSDEKSTLRSLVRKTTSP